MRHLISSICIAGLVAAPSVALAQANKEDLRDARCIAAMLVMTDQKKTKKSDEWILTSVMVYSLGRLEARNEQFDLSALIKEVFEDEDEASLMGRATSCIDNMVASMKVLETIGGDG